MSERSPISSSGIYTSKVYYVNDPILAIFYSYPKKEACFLLNEEINPGTIHNSSVTDCAADSDRQIGATIRDIQSVCELRYRFGQNVWGYLRS